jgi:hypothetical protein
MSTIVLRPDVTFRAIEDALAQLGWSGGATTTLAPLVPGEPEMAMWRRQTARLVYTCNPTVWFRTLEGRAVSPDDWRAVVDGLPYLSDEDVVGLLHDTDDERIVLGIYAAGALGLTSAAPVIDALSSHPRPIVRHVAVSIAREWQ